MNEIPRALTPENEDDQNSLKDVSDAELYERLNVKRKQLHERVVEAWGGDERVVDDPLLLLSRDVDNIVNEIYARKLHVPFAGL